MKNDASSWDETLRQRLLEIEQDSDYPAWNEQRVWQKVQQQIAENQIVITQKQPKLRTLFWYAAAASLLLFFSFNHQIGTMERHAERSISKAQNENKDSALPQNSKEAKKNRIYTNIKKEVKKHHLSLMPTQDVVRQENTIVEIPKFVGFNQALSNIPSLPIKELLLEPQLSVQMPQKGNCTILFLPLLHEEKPLARLFRHFKRFNTEGTLPSSVSNINIPILVQRIIPQ